MPFKQLKLCAAFMILIAQQHAQAWNQEMIWVGDKDFPTSIQYTGPSGGIARATIPAEQIGQSVLAYCWSSYPVDASVEYTTALPAASLPPKVIINGIDVPIEVSVTDGVVIKYNEFITLVRKTQDVPTQQSNTIKGGRCQNLGTVYDVPSSSQRMNLEMLIPSSLPAGNYTGEIRMKRGLMVTYSNVPEGNFMSDFLVSSTLGGGSNTIIPYNIQITGVCTVGPQNVSLRHGYLNPATGPENEVTAEVQAFCTSDSSLKLSLIAISPGSESYGGGISVGLGKGWNSLLRIINPADGSEGSAVDVSVQANKPVSLTLNSTLKSTSASATGTLNGVAVLQASFN